MFYKVVPMLVYDSEYWVSAETGRPIVKQVKLNFCRMFRYAKNGVEY